MASRLRPPGPPKPVGSKLLRPAGGSNLKPVLGIRKPSPQPAVDSMKGVRQSPSATRKMAGPAKQGRPQQVKSSVNHVSEKPTVEAATGEQGLKVGDSVLANGKPGVVAFLGTTQFAKGNWAGIVLDSLEGKNNGCVNGVQYFDCEPNRGLFAKPEKIKFVSRGIGGGRLQSPAAAPPPPPAAPAGGTQVQFAVGDRVLMDGQKEGIVGFVGSTQFAKGVWAGIILDTPEGKNDGSVAGVQYFGCKPNHGLFTRLTKLRLVSKAPSSSPAPPAQPQPQEGGQRSSQPTPVDLKALHNQLQVGDLVLVGGAKEGILRYLGPTEFARGVWVGVELPEPMGKNDGAISGKR